VIVAKCHHLDRHARREWAVYERIAPFLDQWLPQRLGFIESALPVLLFAWLPPWDNEREGLSRPANIQLGQFLSTLHAVPHIDADHVTPRDALMLRLDRLKHGAPQQCPSVLDRITTLLTHGAPGHRTLCHRDFAPRNWRRFSTTERLCVIDWGQARPDVSAADFVHLVPQWLRQPENYAAFAEGYGRVFTDDELAWCIGVMGLHGLASVAWGHTHRNARAYRDGMLKLDTLMNMTGSRRLSSACTLLRTQT